MFIDYTSNVWRNSHGSYPFVTEQCRGYNNESLGYGYDKNLYDHNDKKSLIMNFRFDIDKDYDNIIEIKMTCCVDNKAQVEFILIREWQRHVPDMMRLQRDYYNICVLLIYKIRCT